MKNNFITIQGWMVTELKLSGNDLLTFALIFGFCQDGESEFKGSIKYLCDWLNCTRPTAMKALINLVDKNLIFKESKSINGVIFNRYKINLEVVKNLYIGGKETLLGGGKETLHNNNNIDNNKDITISSEKKETLKTWKNDYDIYLSELREAFKAIKLDLAWISEQEKFNPNVDIILSIQKACTNFWATEGGWKNKKSKRIINIDWRSTFANAIQGNRVFKEPFGAKKEPDKPNFVNPAHKKFGEN